MPLLVGVGFGPIKQVTGDDIMPHSQVYEQPFDLSTGSGRRKLRIVHFKGLRKGKGDGVKQQHCGNGSTPQQGHECFDPSGVHGRRNDDQAGVLFQRGAHPGQQLD
jgi:hypothetical protein